MKYFLIEPTHDRVGVIRKIFENEEEVNIWVEQCRDDEAYNGWFITHEKDIGKLD